MKTLLRLLALAAALAPVSAPAQPRRLPRMLFITESKGFKHSVVTRKDPDTLSTAEEAVTQIARNSGLFEVECTQETPTFTESKLEKIDVVMFYTTGPIPLQRGFAALERWFKGGKAIIAVHSATDTLADYPPYSGLINGSFDGHPWGSGATVSLAVHEPAHPAARPWGAEFTIKDEIYQYTNYDPKAVRVLYSLDMSRCKTKRPYHVPVCWVREVERGRLFYTNLGHNEATWSNPKFRDHLVSALRWALRLEEGSARPNPELQFAEQIRAFALVTEPGKKGAEMAARAEAIVRADPAWAEFLYGDIDAARRIPDDRAARHARLWERLEQEWP